MDVFKTQRLTQRRRTTMFMGGDTVAGAYLPKQPVTVSKLADEDEDLWSVYDVNGKLHKVDGCELNPHPDSPVDNAEFVALMLEWGKTAMVHPFILTAIEEYAKTVAATPAEEMTTGFMHGQVWKDTALEVLGWFAARQAADEERRNKLRPVEA